MCLAKAMLGDSYKTAVIELNASDDRYSVRLCFYWIEVSM